MSFPYLCHDKRNPCALQHLRHFLKYLADLVCFRSMRHDQTYGNHCGSRLQRLQTILCPDTRSGTECFHSNTRNLLAGRSVTFASNCRIDNFCCLYLLFMKNFSYYKHFTASIIFNLYLRKFLHLPLQRILSPHIAAAAEIALAPAQGLLSGKVPHALNPRGKACDRQSHGLRYLPHRSSGTTARKIPSSPTAGEPSAPKRDRRSHTTGMDGFRCFNDIVDIVTMFACQHTNLINVRLDQCPVPFPARSLPLVSGITGFRRLSQSSAKALVGTSVKSLRHAAGHRHNKKRLLQAGGIFLS